MPNCHVTTRSISGLYFANEVALLSPAQRKQFSDRIWPRNWASDEYAYTAKIFQGLFLCLDNVDYCVTVMLESI